MRRWSVDLGRLSLMSALFPIAEARLLASNTNLDSPFRIFGLSTIDNDAKSADVRMVVSRGIGPNLDVTFYTDSRSDKVIQIINQPQVCALFWDQGCQMQVRIFGEAAVLSSSDPEFVSALKEIRDSGNTQDYQSINPPGDPLSVPNKPVNNLSPIHFAVVKIHASKLDVLQLSKNGHRRAICSLSKGTWQEHEVTP